jgi:hypothetical protein
MKLQDKRSVSWGLGSTRAKERHKSTAKENDYP